MKTQSKLRVAFWEEEVSFCPLMSVFHNPMEGASPQINIEENEVKKYEFFSVTGK